GKIRRAARSDLWLGYMERERSILSHRVTVANTSFPIQSTSVPCGKADSARTSTSRPMTKQVGPIAAGEIMRHADELARLLMRGGAARERVRPFAAANGAAPLGDAYAIQDRVVSPLQTRHGAPAGYKIGLASKPMQAMCNSDQPTAGVVLADRVHHS